MASGLYRAPKGRGGESGENRQAHPAELWATIGHGIETATGYGKYLHGEAVAVGMIGAAMLSQRMGLVDADVVERHRSVFDKFGLPTSCPGVRRADVMKAMQLDKKVKQGSICWVLLEGIGKAVVRNDVPGQYVEQVLADLKMD